MKLLQLKINGTLYLGEKNKEDTYRCQVKNKLIFKVKIL